MDEGYLQFVVSLLDESTDPSPTEPVAHIVQVKRTRTESDDFLPSQKEFLLRDRAFSWDLSLEEEIHAEVKPLEAAKNVKSSKRTRLPSPKDVKLRMVSPSLERKDLLCPEKNRTISGIAVGENVAGVEARLIAPLLTSSSYDHRRSYQSSGECNRIGAYTKEERQQIIERFRAKKQRRVWRKQIKYDCRKRLADTRPRVKGRFVSRKEFSLENNFDPATHDLMELYDDSADSISSIE